MESKFATPPKGLICPVITPLKKDNTLDTASFGKLLGHVCRAADGVILCDVVWGEGLVLPKETRIRVNSFALETIMGRMPVFITITGKSQKETQRFMAEADYMADRMDYPGQIFWVDYPLYYHSNRELPQMYRDLTSLTQNPFILGNSSHLIKMRKGPARHYNIRTNVLKKIAQNPAIKGMIFSGSLKRSLNYQQAVRFRSDFTFYDGDEAVFLRNPGTCGLVAGGSNLIPDKWLEITRSSLNRYDAERQFYNHQASIWESGIMVHSLYSIYKTEPARYMKQILRKVGIIAEDSTISKGKQNDSTMEKDITTFLKAYNMI